MALDSEPDLNAGLEHLTANARAIGKAIKDPAERDRVANIVKTRAYADFAKYGPAIGHGVIVNNWARPCVVGNYGVDYIARALTTYGGIWANVMPEVLYYRASTDGSGTQLSGDNSYTLTFPKEQLPQSFAKYLVGDRSRHQTFSRVAQSKKQISD